MKAVIICDGEFPKKDYPRYIIRNADFIICCDGAAGTFMRNASAIFSEARLPDVIIGDMDSLPASLRRKLSADSGDRRAVLVHETEQDHNDQTKAFRYIMEHCPDVTGITILGAGGKREDHTIGNMSLLMEYARTYDLDSRGITVDMVSDYTTAFAITDSTEFDCGEGRKVSVFTPDNSLTIKSEGLMYKTDDVVFDNWWKATLNTATEDRVRLTFSHRSIALIVLN